jgi:hypothetical protein
MLLRLSQNLVLSYGKKEDKKLSKQGCPMKEGNQVIYQVTYLKKITLVASNIYSLM